MFLQQKYFNKLFLVLV